MKCPECDRQFKPRDTAKNPRICFTCEAWQDLARQGLRMMKSQPFSKATIAYWELRNGIYPNN